MAPGHGSENALYYCILPNKYKAVQSKAQFKRRTLHVPNLMQMSKIFCSSSFALDTARVNFHVWNGALQTRNQTNQVQALTGNRCKVSLIEEIL